VGTQKIGLLVKRTAHNIITSRAKKRGRGVKMALLPIHPTACFIGREQMVEAVLHAKEKRKPSALELKSVRAEMSSDNSLELTTCF
jgi:hypothetical protein